MIKTCCGLLEEKNIKIAFIESASSGYLSSQFSICKGEGAEILIGGLICYDVSVKTSVLGISKNLINSHTAESMPVTVALAEAGKKCSVMLTGLSPVQGYLNQVVARHQRNRKEHFCGH